MARLYFVTITKNFGNNRAGHTCALTGEEYARAGLVGAASLLYIEEDGKRVEVADQAAEAPAAEPPADDPPPADDAGDIPLAGLTDEENATRAAAAKKNKKPKS